MKYLFIIYGYVWVGVGRRDWNVYTHIGMFDVVLNDMCVVCRYVWDGVGRWKWAQVHCSPPLRVKREDGGWRDECVSRAAPGPRGCHVVHVTATVSQQQCVCTVWWGEVGRHEGLSLLHVLVALSGDTSYVLVNYTKYHEQTLIVMLAHTHTRSSAMMSSTPRHDTTCIHPLTQHVL